MQAAIPLPRLEAALGVQDAQWLQRLAQGKDGEGVKPRTLTKSISCGKTFRGKQVSTYDRRKSWRPQAYGALLV
jgi:nucleotidyltransferase/DNA polymerase involved in DNA repair